MRQVIRNITNQLGSSPKQMLLFLSWKISSRFLQSQANKYLLLTTETTKTMEITTIPIITHQTKNRLNKIMNPHKIHSEFQKSIINILVSQNEQVTKDLLRLISSLNPLMKMCWDLSPLFWPPMPNSKGWTFNTLHTTRPQIRN